MTDKFANFKEMGKFLTAQTIEQEERALKERFDKVVGGRIDKIPMGCQFSTDLPGVESISVVKQPGNEGLHVMVFYKDSDEKSRHETFSISKEGNFNGAPKGIKLSQEKIYGSVLDSLDRIGLDFWHNNPQQILPPDWPVSPKENPGKKKFIETDPRRIEYLRKQPDALFGFLGNNGFRNYYGFVFKNFIVLENPKCENAAYFVELPNLSEEEIKVAQTYSGREELIENYWKPYENRGKWDLYTSGHERMTHLHIDNWIPQIKERLNTRNPLPDNQRDVQLIEQRGN